MMQMGSSDYYRARERAERRAAEQAQCPEARRAHEEMARAYARLGIEAITPSESDGPFPTA